MKGVGVITVFWTAASHMLTVKSILNKKKDLEK